MLRVISPLTDRKEQVLSLAIDCAFAVHRETGPGFREKIYQTAYCLELNARGISFECERKIDVRYKQWVIPGPRVDLVIEGLVMVEIKAVSKAGQAARTTGAFVFEDDGVLCRPVAKFQYRPAEERAAPRGLD